MSITTRYPGGPLTPVAAYHLLRGDKPLVAYRSYDDTSVFYLMGAAAAPYADRAYPAIALKALKGVAPPWKAIEQKGATQDGSSFVTALYNPLDISMTVEARGVTPEDCQRVITDWIAAWDAKQPGELSVFTPAVGRWWTPVRWARDPVDEIRGGRFTRQRFQWSARGYDAFWRSYDHVSTGFRFAYRTVSDTFGYTTQSGLGSGWTVAYSGAGSGTIHADGSQVVSTLANNKTAVCRKASFVTVTNNQVAEMIVGKFAHSWWYPTNAYNDLWVRMGNTGTAGDDGVRLRVGHRTLRLSYFKAGQETLLRQVWMQIPTQRQTRFTVVAGFEGNERLFKVLRNGATIVTVQESGTGSQVGAGFRSAGFGMSAAGTSSPATVRDWGVGDNTTVAQTGFVDFVNVGDQDMWPRYTCFGPGTFFFGNGPGSTDYVKFGPLLPNQVMQVRTEPAKRGVVDLTAIPPTPQELTIWQRALQDFISFATGNNTPPLLAEIESMFGIRPPQGNPYSLLSGRFSVPIPPKPAAGPATTYHISVGIDDGNADSQIIAAGTPLRRWPF